MKLRQKATCSASFHSTNHASFYLGNKYDYNCWADTDIGPYTNRITGPDWIFHITGNYSTWCKNGRFQISYCIRHSKPKGNCRNVDAVVLTLRKGKELGKVACSLATLKIHSVYYRTLWKSRERRLEVGVPFWCWTHFALIKAHH